MEMENIYSRKILLNTFIDGADRYIKRRIDTILRNALMDFTPTVPDDLGLLEDLVLGGNVISPDLAGAWFRNLERSVMLPGVTRELSELSIYPQKVRQNSNQYKLKGDSVYCEFLAKNLVKYILQVALEKFNQRHEHEPITEHTVYNTEAIISTYLEYRFEMEKTLYRSHFIYRIREYCRFTSPNLIAAPEIALIPVSPHAPAPPAPREPKPQTTLVKRYLETLAMTPEGLGTCPICFEELTAKETTVPDCTHLVCNTCCSRIDKCPICRGNL